MRQRIITALAAFAAFSLAAPLPAQELLEADQESISAFSLESGWNRELIYWWLEAEYALRQGEISKALVAFRIVAERSAHPEAIRRWVQTALQAGDIATARNALFFWSRVAPHDEEMLRLGKHLQQIEEHFEREAAQRLFAILEKDALQRERNLLGLIPALHELDAEQALRIVSGIPDRYPGEPAAYLVQAHAARRAYAAELAWEAAQKALYLRPDWEPGWRLVAELAAEQLRAPEAFRLWEQLMGQPPENPELLLAYAHLVAALLEQTAASELDPYRFLERALAYPEQRARALAFAARWGSAGINPQRAEQLLLRYGHEDSRLRLAAAQMWLDRQEPRRALVLLRDDPDAHQETAAERAALRAQALASLKAVPQALRLLPPEEQPVKSLMREARLWQKAGNLEQARNRLQQALQAAQQDARVLYDYALVLDLLGQRHAAEGYLRKLVAIHPLDAHGLNALGYLLVEQGRDFGEAEQLIAMALRLNPDDGYILDSLGWLRFKENRFEEARRLLERAWYLTGEREVGEHLLALYHRIGESERAERLRNQLRLRFKAAQKR